MHREILSPQQKALLPLLKKFSPEFGLVGGTAVALHLGHRQSIDFDLFTSQRLDHQKISRTIKKDFSLEKIIVDERDEFTVIVSGVRITFLHYPYPIKYSEKFDQTIKLPDLLSLAAMKAYALGRRAKWKDYVDLYFIAQEYQGLEKIIKKAREIFKQEFNEKIFRVQLAYFKDIDFSEKIAYLPGFEIDNKIIQEALQELSLS